MTAEQFWRDDPNLLLVYQKAYYKKLYEESYLFGFYNNIAFSVAFANAFREKGKKAIEYPNKPIDPFETSIKKEDLERHHRNLMANQVEWLKRLKG